MARSYANSSYNFTYGKFKTVKFTEPKSRTVVAGGGVGGPGGETRWEMLSDGIRSQGGEKSEPWDPLTNTAPAVHNAVRHTSESGKRADHTYSYHDKTKLKNKKEGKNLTTNSYKLLVLVNAKQFTP